MDIDSASVSKVLGQEVPELYVTIALHERQGFNLAELSNVFATPEEELQRILDDELYKQTRQLIALSVAAQQVKTDVSWDTLENASLEKLSSALKTIVDPEFHLKVAAVANKAQRRHRSHTDTLSPGTVAPRVNLTLRETFVKHLSGGDKLIQERRIDISKAASYRVSPKEVKGFLEGPSLEDQLETELKKAMAG